MKRTEVRAAVARGCWRVAARPGDALGADGPILVVESIKMEIPFAAPAAGRLAKLRFAEVENL